MNRGWWLYSLVLCLGATGLTGCGGGGRGEPSALDSVLIQTESLMAKGQDRAARTYLRDSYFSASNIWRGQSLPEGLRMLGEFSQSAALFDSAYFFYDRAREEYRNQAKRSNAYSMTLAIGSLWLQMNRPHDVRALYEEALRLAVVFGDSADARELRWALLPVYAELEEREAERKTADQLFAWARNAGDRKSEARVLEETGVSLADRGESAAAIDAFLRAMTLADQTKDSVRGVKIMVHLGRALHVIGRSQDALETFHTALQRKGTLARNHDLHVELLMRTGNLLLRLNDPDHALQYFRTALPIAQQRGNALAEAYCTVQMGHATTRRNHPEALAFFRSGYDQFRAFAYAPGVAYALVSLGEIAESENRLTDALQLYEAAAKEQAGLAAKRGVGDLFDECETAGLGPQGNNASSALVTLLLQLGRGEDAYAVQQRANIRALSGDFATWTFRTGNAAIDALLAEYAAARSDQAGAEREAERLMASRPENKALLREIQGVLQSSRERAKECTEELQRVRPDLAPIAGAEGLRPADIQKRLPEGTALLTFIPTRRSWFTSVITRQQALVEVTGQTSEQVLRAAREYTQILRERIAEADTLGPGYSVLDNRLRDLSRRLHEALLLPVERALRPAARVAVQIPADMPVIPVHALRRGGSTGNPALIEVCDVHYVTTPYALTTRPVSTAPVRSVTCIGYPGNTEWDVEYELRDVRYFFKEALMLFGREATMDSLRGIRSDVLHMAVEVEYGVRAPLLGGLYLSDGVSPIGKRREPLSLLSGLPAHRLVILSNLSSMARTFDPGLAFVFSANGTEGTIANVVPPLRGAKKAFGEYLYTVLQAGGSPESAYRKAQLEMIRTRDFGAQHYWAPFLYWKGN